MSLTNIDRTAAFGGQLVFPDDDEYDEARRVWNRAIDRRPAVIARCTGPEDVAAALRLAREHGLTVAVRSGGHSFPGHSTCDGGLVVDLRSMKELTVDAERRTLTAGPGLTWAEVADATAAHGLAAAGGHVSAVGIAGLTLGGGNGWLSRAYGLTCDNLLAADVVTASGELVSASAEENADLYWGLRGGGGNFGVVVRFTYRLHPVSELYAGMAIHPAGRAAEVLRFVRDLNAGAPDEVSIAAGLMTAPSAPFVPPHLHGQPVVMLPACYVGPVEDGERALAPLREFGPPAVELFGPAPFVQLQRLFDASGVSTPFHMRSHLVAELDDEGIDTLVRHALPVTSPLSAAIMLPMGGAIGRVSPEATAFRHRDAAYCLEFGAAWFSPDDDARPHREWSNGLWEAMRPWSIGTEVNHLLDEGPERVRAAYGDNYSRLAALKRAWDPDNVFRLNQNIRPSG
jgi:FAD/FMN-containing dehydrogenase